MADGHTTSHATSSSSFRTAASTASNNTPSVIVLYSPKGELPASLIGVVVRAAKKRLGKSPLVAYVQNEAFTLSVDNEPHADMLLSQPLCVKTHMLSFFRGERRGHMVRLFGLPFSCTPAAVQQALSDQLG